jgi:hypothetical protein
MEVGCTSVLAKTLRQGLRCGLWRVPLCHPAARWNAKWPDPGSYHTRRLVGTEAYFRARILGSCCAAIEHVHDNGTRHRAGLTFRPWGRFPRRSR